MNIITTARHGADEARVDVAGLLAALPDVAFVTDSDGRILCASGQALDKLEFGEGELIGQRVSDFMVSGDSIPCLVDDAAGRCAAGARVSHYRRKHGSLFTARITEMPLDAAAGAARTLTLLSEVSANGQFAHVIHALYDISSRRDLTSEDKIAHILELGCRVFGLPTGIVSMVEGDCYTVVSTFSTEADLQPGLEFALAETYCCHTLAADGPVCFHRASEQGLAVHPCFQKFGLEGYIGVPLFVEGHLFGTLNFSGLKPRPSFRGSDLEFCKLFAAWIAQELGFSKAVAALRHQAEVDPLTGCLNRRAFERAAREVLVTHGHTLQPATLVMIDIDSFKAINDRDGHAVGDKVLRSLVGLCAEMFRSTDVVGRLGGDEFALLLRGADTKVGSTIIEVFQQRARAVRIDAPDGPVGFTVSCGLAGLGVSTGDLPTWFANADAELYQAKRAGRDRFSRREDADEFSRAAGFRR